MEDKTSESTDVEKASKWVACSSFRRCLVEGLARRRRLPRPLAVSRSNRRADGRLHRRHGLAAGHRRMRQSARRSSSRATSLARVAACSSGGGGGGGGWREACEGSRSFNSSKLGPLMAVAAKFRGGGGKRRHHGWERRGNILLRSCGGCSKLRGRGRFLGLTFRS